MENDNFAIVDAHHHLWDLSDNNNWAWLTENGGIKGL